MLDDQGAAWALQQIGGMFALYGKPVPSASLLNMLLDDIEGFGIPVIQKAMKRLRATYDGRSPITSALLIQACESVCGCLEPDEAWSVALGARDEASTVVWNEEIQQAWFSVAELMKGRADLVAARRAFIETYTRLRHQSRELGRVPRVCASLGSDAQLRAPALELARSRGFDVSQLEGTAVGGALALCASPAVALLDGPAPKLSDASSVVARQALARMREVLRTLPQAQEHARAQKLQEELRQVREKKAQIDSAARAIHAQLQVSKNKEASNKEPTEASNKEAKQASKRIESKSVYGNQEKTPPKKVARA